VSGALVELGAVTDPAFIERALDRGDILGRHGLVIVGVAEIDLGRDLPGSEVRAVVIVGDEAAGVKRAECGDAIGER
jgi:hypothetical protein